MFWGGMIMRFVGNKTVKITHTQHSEPKRTYHNVISALILNSISEKKWRRQLVWGWTSLSNTSWWSVNFSKWTQWKWERTRTKQADRLHKNNGKRFIVSLRKKSLSRWVYLSNCANKWSYRDIIEPSIGLCYIPALPITGLWHGAYIRSNALVYYWLESKIFLFLISPRSENEYNKSWSKKKNALVCGIK